MSLACGKRHSLWSGLTTASSAAAECGAAGEWGRKGGGVVGHGCLVLVGNSLSFLRIKSRRGGSSCNDRLVNSVWTGSSSKGQERAIAGLRLSNALLSPGSTCSCLHPLVIIQVKARSSLFLS